MLRQILVASAAALLLAACQQQPQAVTAPMAKNYTVYFDTDKATLSPESVATIATAANSFKASGARAVAVSGHTDTTGTAAYNLDLSKRRAASVSAELQRNGVPAGAIAALGYGETNLPVPTAANVAERRNRSVDIAISEREAASLMSDTQYCKALSSTYRRYRPNQIDETAAAAMARCETADAASAIPVLEQSLTSMKIPLPARS
ncbi:MAG: OmpA family protein [Proteobacteria bacterium]|nr:OmpA family protein [Pseudomonadota bacterium]